MKIDVTKVLEIKDSIACVRKRMDSDSDFVNEQTIKMQKLCPHPTIKSSSKYSRGGYDYLSEVRITEICSICDKLLASYKDPNHQGYHD